jgi:hypothetical protein
MHFFEHTKTNKHKIENGKRIESLEEEKINQNGNILIRGIKDGVPFLKHIRPNGLVLNNNRPTSNASRRKSTKKSKSKPKSTSKSVKKSTSKNPKKSKTPMKK